MNRIQRVIVGVGVVTMALAALHPPQTFMGSPLSWPLGPRYIYSMFPNGEGFGTDWPRLLAVLGGTALVTALAVFALRTRRQPA